MTISVGEASVTASPQMFPNNSTLPGQCLVLPHKEVELVPLPLGQDWLCDC